MRRGWTTGICAAAAAKAAFSALVTGDFPDPASPSRVSLPRYGGRVGLRIVLFEMLWGGGEEIASIVADVNRWSPQCKRRTT